MAAVRLPPLLLLIAVTLSIPILSSSQSDAEALLKFKQSLIVPRGALDSWAPGSSPCQDRWLGVYCSRTSINGLHLADLDLSGSIDVLALTALDDIKTIRLTNNSFSGPLPLFNKLSSLRGLFLSGNNLSGEIPNDYFTGMTNLRRLSLDNNKLTGKIPESLMQLSNLKELHLEGNQFSGSIPPLKEGAASIVELDLSRNNLEGEIPRTYSNFNPKAFEGNNLLCGKPLNVECNGVTATDGSGSSASNNSSFNKGIIAALIAAVAVTLVLAAIFSATRNRSSDFSVLGQERLSDNEAVEPQAPESVRKPNESTRKSGESTRKGSQNGKGGMGDLLMVNDEKGVFGLPDLMKAAAEVLGNGSLGSAYKAVMASGLSVVVKRIREMNKLGRDAFDTEMRRLGRLRHPNILTPLAYHYRREEKLVVSEYMPKSSLLYVLHGDRGIVHADLNWPTRLKIIRGVARGMDFLHKEFASSELPHGNLKSSNVLLSESYDPVLSDYAFLPLLHPTAAQALFAFKTPEYIQSQQVSQKSDVYCLGIVILEILTGKFPSQYLSNGKGGTDIVQWVQSSVAEQREEELIDPEVASNADSVNGMIKLLRIGAACIESNPDKRLDMREAIRRIEEVQT